MFRPLPVAMLAAFVSLVLAVAEAHAQSRLWHATIGAGYDMPEGDAGEVTDDDYSLVLGVTLTPEQQQLAYYADFQFAEYDLTPEVADFFQVDDGSIRRYSVSTGVQWSAPTKGALGFYVNAGIAGHYLDFNLEGLDTSTAFACEPWWWWCTPLAGVGDVLVESEGTTRFGYSAGVGVDLKLGDSAKLFVEGRHNWVELEERVRYVSVMFGFRW